jgi:hypothetical protein
MNETLSESLYDTSDDSSDLQSPSISSKPQFSGSFKAGDKKEETDNCALETPEEKEKRKMERKVRKRQKKERKEKKSKFKDSTDIPEEKAQRREEKNEVSKVEKGDDKAEDQQKLDIAEELQYKSLGTDNVTQAADIDGYCSDDDNINMSVMVVPHWGQQVKCNRQHQQENLDESLTYDDERAFTQETVLPDEKESLMCTVKTLRQRLEEVESENRQLHEKNSAYNTQIEEQLAYRKELNGVQEELEQLRIERDRAIYRAGQLTIESGKVSESYDRVAESKVVIEQMRRMIQISLAQQSTSASTRSVSKKVDRRSGFRKLGSFLGFRNKNDYKNVVSTYDDDCMLDLTEDNTSLSSEDAFDLERIDFAEQSSVASFTDDLQCSSDQLRNRRLLKMNLILDPSKNKKKC